MPSEPPSAPRGDETRVLLQQWYAGDREALDALMGENLEWMRRYLRRTTPKEVRQRFESLDLVQDAAVQLLRRGPRFAPENRAQFRALLSKVLLYTVRDRLDHLHAAKRNAERPERLPSVGVSRIAPVERSPTLPDAAAMREEKRTWVRLGLELVEPSEREVIELRQFQELGFEEIAERLGLASADAARMRFNRALTNLTVKVQQARNAVQLELGV